MDAEGCEAVEGDGEVSVMGEDHEEMDDVSGLDHQRYDASLDSAGVIKQPQYLYRPGRDSMLSMKLRGVSLVITRPAMVIEYGTGRWPYGRKIRGKSTLCNRALLENPA